MNRDVCEHFTPAGIPCVKCQTSPNWEKTMGYKPCDCIELIDGFYMPRCGCQNSGDLAYAAAWCEEANTKAETDKLRHDIERAVQQNTELLATIADMEVRHAAVMLHAQTHADEYNALCAERDAALKDAERYRFIRAGESGTYNTILIHAGSQLDAAIDAAMQGGRDA